MDLFIRQYTAQRGITYMLEKPWTRLKTFSVQWVQFYFTHTGLHLPVYDFSKSAITCQAAKFKLKPD